MAIKTVSEILDTIKARTENQTDDETLAFVEDITDTLNDLSNKTESASEWEKKYNDNDNKWRQKYRDRFFSNEPVSEEPTLPTPLPEENKVKTYDELFTHSKNAK